MRIAAHGLAADLPAGWEGAISRAAAPPGRTASAAAGLRLPTVHLATRPLPPERGDFGSGLVEHLTADDAFVALIEFDPASAGTALFDRPGIPRDIAPGQLRAAALQRTIPGQAGHQVFCTEAGRAFCLYVVVGSQAHAGRVLPDIRLALRSLAVGSA